MEEFEAYQKPEETFLVKLIKNKWVIVGIVAVVMLLTNPGLDQHKSAVKVFVTKLYTEATKEVVEDKENMFAGLGMAFGSLMINNLVDTMVSSQNLLLFSLTKMTSDGETKTVGIGVFGNVFIFIKDSDLKELDKN